MPLILVTSREPGEGKTGVAAAIARQAAYSGTAAKLVRLGSPEGAAAVRDALWFGGLDFAPGSDPQPVAAAADPGAGALVVAEGSLEEVKTAALPSARMVLVARGSDLEVPEGLVPADIVVMGGERTGPLEARGGARVFGLADDRTLAGFAVSDLRDRLRAEVLVEGDGADATCDYLVIAPISSDAGQPYFRRFHDQAVVARFDKTDMHLAAIRAAPHCLVLTGGRYPSDYVYDAARASQLPVLLSRTDTENTVIALEGIWGQSPFRGDRKLDRMAELLEAAGFFA